MLDAIVPYLAQIPGDSEAVLPAFIGSLSVAFYTQAKTMGLEKKVKMFSSSASLESIDPGDVQGAAGWQAPCRLPSQCSAWIGLSTKRKFSQKHSAGSVTCLGLPRRLLAFVEGAISSVSDPTVARISSLVLMSVVLLARPQGPFKGLTR